jgi:hypothetical protein
MTSFNNYLSTLTAVLSLGTVVLAAYNVQHLDAYLALYVIGYFIVTALFGHLHPRAARSLQSVGYALIGAFLLMSALRAIFVFQLGRP